MNIFLRKFPYGLAEMESILDFFLFLAFSTKVIKLILMQIQLKLTFII